MARPSNLVKSTDFTTLRQVQRLSISLSVPDNTMPAETIASWAADATVPDGAYVENATISYVGKNFPANIVSVGMNGGQIEGIIGIFQLNPTTYRLKVNLNNQAQSSANISGFTCRATLNLSLSPFVSQG